MKHEPRRFLRHRDVPVQLWAADAFQVHHLRVDRENPLAKGDGRLPERVSHPDGEDLAAAPAAVRH
ncbi:MAG: hypothetical protein OXC82_04045 [Rhodobacteraceae bacterium]|nr:hypothetical protein [Paracoccaceae bacterium]